jgi:hypothetical protein
LHLHHNPGNHGADSAEGSRADAACHAECRGR